MRLLDQSSPEVQLSFTVYPAHLVRSLSTGDTSPGVPCPYSAHGVRVHVRFPGSPGCPGDAGGSLSASFGVARRFSQPLSDFFLSSPSHHFRVGGTPGVLPTGVHSSHEASTIRHRRPALLALFPWFARVSFLGGDNHRRAARCLGCSRRRLCGLQGFRLRESRSASPKQ